MTTTPQTFFRFLAGAAVAVVALYLIWYFSSIVVYILVSAVLAVMGRPLVSRLTGMEIRGWRIPRWLAALCTLVVIWIVFATLCSLFVPLVFNKLNQFAHVDFATVVASIEEPLSRAQEYLQSLFAQPSSTFSLSEALTQTLRQVIDLDSLNALFSSIVGVVLSSVIAIFSISFITFFFLKDDGLFYTMVTSVFPERYHDNITRALDSVTVLLARYFTGILSESLLLMVIISLTMMAFGDEGGRCRIHRAGDGCDECRTLCRTAHRRNHLGVRRYRDADRRPFRRPYGDGYRRLAADPQGAG